MLNLEYVVVLLSSYVGVITMAVSRGVLADTPILKT